jgi:hypothetical protein
MSPGNAWSRPLNFAITQLPQPPSQLYRFTSPRDLPSKYTFMPHAEVPKLHYRQDPRLAHKLNCTCSLSSNLSVHSRFQTATRKPVSCETGIHSPAQNIPASRPRPSTMDESHSDSSVAPKSRRSVPKLARTKEHRATEQHDTTHLREEHGSNPSNQNSLQSAEFPDPTGPRILQVQQLTHANMRQHDHQPPRQRLGNSHTELQIREFINYIGDFYPNFSFQYLLQTISVMLLQHRYGSALPVIFSNFLANLLGIPHNGQVLHSRRHLILEC